MSVVSRSLNYWPSSDRVFVCRLCCNATSSTTRDIIVFVFVFVFVFLFDSSKDSFVSLVYAV